jgi:hypothetical protein
MTENMDAARRLLAISCVDALALMTDHLEGALSAGDATRMRGRARSRFGVPAAGVFVRGAQCSMIRRLG